MLPGKTKRLRSQWSKLWNVLEELFKVTGTWNKIWRDNPMQHKQQTNVIRSSLFFLCLLVPITENQYSSCKELWPSDCMRSCLVLLDNRQTSWWSITVVMKIFTCIIRAATNINEMNSTNETKNNHKITKNEW